MSRQLCAAAGALAATRSSVGGVDKSGRLPMALTAHLLPQAPMQQARVDLSEGHLPKACPLRALLPRSLSKRHDECGLGSGQRPLRLLCQILVPAGADVEAVIAVLHPLAPARVPMAPAPPRANAHDARGRGCGGRGARSRGCGRWLFRG